MAGEKYSLSVKDYSKESSVMSIKVGVVTAGTLPGLLSDIADFVAATEDVILGVIQSDSLVAYRTAISNALPTDPSAQRERKWLVTYADNTAYFDAPTNAIPNEAFGRVYTMEIPTANLTATLLIDNTDFADMEHATWVAWINAFEAVARSPAGGVPEVLEITAVGRNI